MNTKHQLRNQLTTLRKKLNDNDKINYSKQICKQLLSHFDLTTFSSIALYHALGNEVDLSPLYKYNDNIYLPVMQANNSMQFCLFESNENLKQNAFGIHEPHNTAILKPDDLELCLIPLVGFNRNGSRLGMGGGYYDRYFELNKSKQRPTILAGIAYDFQENVTIKSEPWDIPLDIIFTNKEVITP